MKLFFGATSVMVEGLSNCNMCLNCKVPCHEGRLLHNMAVPTPWNHGINLVDVKMGLSCANFHHASKHWQQARFHAGTWAIEVSSWPGERNTVIPGTE
jgi:hypothetical protein